MSPYLNALATMTDFSALVFPSVIDMAVLSGIVFCWYAVADIITLIKTMFHRDEIEISGSILFLPSEQDWKTSSSLGMEAY